MWVKRYGWGRVGWFLVEWWNYISFTFLCIYEKHRHHRYLCHHCVRYRCLIFDRDPEYHQNYLRFHYSIFIFVILTVNSPLLHYISFNFLRDNGKIVIHQYHYLFIGLFDCGYIFRSGPSNSSEYFYFYHFDCQYSPSSTMFRSSSFVKIKMTTITTIWAIIATKLV